MNIDITRLKSGIDSQVEIDMLYSFDKEMLKKTDIISLDNISVKGYITSNSIDDYDLDVNVDGIMVLPSSLTLEPTDYKFSIKIEGNIDELLKEINETLKKNQNTIDILPIIWENILMEIPMKVVSKDANTSNLKGDGWEFVTNERKKTNPELEKLKDLL